MHGADSRAKYYNGVSYGSDIAWKANSQCVLQDLWVYKHGASS